MTLGLPPSNQGYTYANMPPEPAPSSQGGAATSSLSSRELGDLTSALDEARKQLGTMDSMWLRANDAAILQKVMTDKTLFTGDSPIRRQIDRLGMTGRSLFGSAFITPEPAKPVTFNPPQMQQQRAPQATPQTAQNAYLNNTPGAMPLNGGPSNKGRSAFDPYTMRPTPLNTPANATGRIDANGNAPQGYSSTGFPVGGGGIDFSQGGGGGGAKGAPGWGVNPDGSINYSDNPTARYMISQGQDPGQGHYEFDPLKDPYDKVWVWDREPVNAPRPDTGPSPQTLDQYLHGKDFGPIDYRTGQYKDSTKYNQAVSDYWHQPQFTNPSQPQPQQAAPAEPTQPQPGEPGFVPYIGYEEPDDSGRMFTYHGGPWDQESAWHPSDQEYTGDTSTQPDAGPQQTDTGPPAGTEEEVTE